MEQNRSGYLPLAKSEYQDEGEVDREFEEILALLPEPAVFQQQQRERHSSSASGKRASKFLCKKYSLKWLVLAYLAGFLSCPILQFFFPSLCLGRPATSEPTSRSSSNTGTIDDDDDLNVLASSYAGERTSNVYPPPSPTNNFPSYFPTDVGYPGNFATGVEAGIVATAPSYPVQSGAPNLVGPSTLPKGKKKKFDIFRHWGNLSPWYSVPPEDFGLDTTPDAPKGCRITGLHLLHRHGARYPTERSTYGGPERFAEKIHALAANWTASGDLEFLNEWTYKLGRGLLTPFGRQQLFDLGAATRIKYGFLLQNFTEQAALPVFRTTSQDRMLYSALNFAIGFFGYPHQDQYLQSITIEAPSFNNTLAPYFTCPNALNASKAERGVLYVEEWTATYLRKALKRHQAQLKGLELTIEDMYTMQQLCAYETVALGYSAFCDLFTEQEWEGFNYALDLHFWYNSAFGSPVARIQGIGYIQELVSRLTQTRIPVHNTSTNATLDDNDETFPLGRSIYIDATHEVVFLNIITALGLNNFAESGPLPSDHIPKKRPFRSSHLSPFATNMQFQLLACDSTPDSEQIRIVINDGVSPLTSLEGCPHNPDGLCPLKEFVKAQQKHIETADWTWACYGDWDVPPGTAWNTTTGDPPARKA
ncbi:phosphoglycerate mutase-like protein [Cantharellus anzutake]|uniref:phosphoglycerate mutase-like protein n=1 Tax=Cantharellus anzutake TaxID=1750568 RepID=UPI001904026E|nr:phosphoglycerate mutase-like protein [Cantharellus anzutake]KAF8330828.1 phosphoglycerate mutase-like protein [Cantharellus anzutake]